MQLLPEPPFTRELGPDLPHGGRATRGDARFVVDHEVPVEELPNLMRAMGYYPTEQEVKNIIDEVKYSAFTQLAVPTTHVNIDEFIRLFVNHRPVYGIGKINIEEAFAALVEATGSTNGKIARGDFTSLLNNEGEQMNTQELEKALLQLVGE